MIVVRRRRKPRKAKPSNCSTCKRHLGERLGCAYGADTKNRIECKWYLGKPVTPKPGTRRTPRGTAKSGKVIRRKARLRLQMDRQAVVAVFGDPDRTEKVENRSLFWYGTSAIIFDAEDLVVDWREGSVNLL